MLLLIKSITGRDLGRLYRGIAFNVVENVAVTGALAFFCLFFVKLYYGAGTGELWALFGALCVCFGIRTVCSIIGFSQTITAAYELTAGVRLRLGDHFRRLPMGFFHKKDLGSLSNAILQDTSLLDFLFSHILITLCTSILLPVCIAFILAPLHAQLFVLAVVPILLAWPVLAKARRVIREQGAERLECIDKTDSAVLEYIQGIRTMKSFGVLGEQNTRLLELVTELSRRSLRIESTTLGYGLIFSAIVDVGFAMLMLAVALLYSAGHIAGVVAVIFLVVSYRFYAPFLDLMQFSILAQYVVNAANRLKALLDTPQLRNPEQPCLPSQYDIRFTDVSFGYGDADVLHHVTFHAREKRMTALVGPSGSGKTTISNLMALFWDNYRGEIHIGGVELRAMDPEKLLGLFAFVFQDVYLFSDTVLGNIWVGDTSAPRERVLEAAKKARCDEFVRQLPQGYDTLVGEGGATLSGGEKQRISIARAILKDAPIVVLDEATTALDPANEALVQDAVDELVCSKTLIVIAHRLGTVVAADQIIVLDSGQIIEKGAHADLLAQQGCYHAMWVSMLGPALENRQDRVPATFEHPPYGGSAKNPQ
jgi:ATP-binding cassette subfamily B protein